MALWVDSPDANYSSVLPYFRARTRKTQRRHSRKMKIVKRYTLIKCVYVCGYIFMYMDAEAMMPTSEHSIEAESVCFSFMSSISVIVLLNCISQAIQFAHFEVYKPVIPIS